ncbi:hypothetical protein VTI74DRAFT_11002 [Chaetomium olivicolor]
MHDGLDNWVMPLADAPGTIASRCKSVLSSSGLPDRRKSAWRTCGHGDIFEVATQDDSQKIINVSMVCSTQTPISSRILPSWHEICGACWVLVADSPEDVTAELLEDIESIKNCILASLPSLLQYGLVCEDELPPRGELEKGFKFFRCRPGSATFIFRVALQAITRLSKADKEVATMEWVRQHTVTPIPKVLAGLGHGREEQPYRTRMVLMEQASGRGADLGTLASTTLFMGDWKNDYHLAPGGFADAVSTNSTFPPPAVDIDKPRFTGKLDAGWRIR